MLHVPSASQHAPVGGWGQGFGAHVVPGAIRVPRKQDGIGEYAATGVHPPSASQHAAEHGFAGPQDVPAPNHVPSGAWQSAWVLDVQPPNGSQHAPVGVHGPAGEQFAPRKNTPATAVQPSWPLIVQPPATVQHAPEHGSAAQLPPGVKVTEPTQPAWLGTAVQFPVVRSQHAPGQGLGLHVLSGMKVDPAGQFATLTTLVQAPLGAQQAFCRPAPACGASAPTASASAPNDAVVLSVKVRAPTRIMFPELKEVPPSPRLPFNQFTGLHARQIPHARAKMGDLLRGFARESRPALNTGSGRSCTAHPPARRCNRPAPSTVV